jgi:hypothetical protein
MDKYLSRKFSLAAVSLGAAIVGMFAGNIDGNTFYLCIGAVLAGYGIPNWLDKKSGGAG